MEASLVLSVTSSIPMVKNFSFICEFPVNSLATISFKICVELTLSFRITYKLHRFLKILTEFSQPLCSFRAMLTSWSLDAFSMHFLLLSLKEFQTFL